MSILKKLVCACLAAAMLPVCGWVYAADNVSGEKNNTEAFVTAYTMPADVAGTEYEAAVSFLQGMGVYDETDFRPWDSLTRAELAEYTVKAFNHTYVGASGVTYFTDVPANSAEAPYINAAVELGYMQGVGGRLFQPAEGALYEQAATVLVIACGYNPNASYAGGFSSGYMQIAASEGINKGISKSGSEELTRGEFAVMLFNAMHADAMITNLDGSGIVYERGDSVLSEKFDMETERGILQIVGDTSIYEDKTCLAGYVQLGGVTYASNGISLDMYLGYELEFYYQDNGTGDLTLAAARPTTRNSVYQIYSSDIEENSTISRIEYSDEKGRSRKVDISLLADFVYNGLGMSAFSDEDILLENGYLQTVDNNGDGQADVVIVSEYKNYVVRALDTEFEVVYDCYGNENLELGTEEYIMRKNGEELPFSSLKKWDVLSVYGTKNSTGEKKIRIEVSDQTVSGVIRKIDEEGYTIDGVQYELAENLHTAIKTGLEQEIEIGTSYTFYLDGAGALAAIDEGITDEFQYALILRLYVDEVTELASVKMYTQDGVQERFQFPARFLYNGIKMDAAEAVSRFNTDYENNTDKCKLVKYKRNADGLITELYSYYGDDSKCIRRNIRYNERTIFTRNYSFMTESSNKNLGGNDMYGIAKDSILFNVPEDFATDKDTGIYDDNDFSIVTVQDFNSSSDYQGTEIYDTDEENRSITVALVKIPTRTNFDTESKTICVNEKHEIYDEEREEVMEVIEGYYNGQPVTLTGRDSDTFQNIKPGDVIHALRNAKGEVTDLRVLFRPGDTQPTGADGPEFETVRTDGTHVNITQYTGKKQAIEVSNPQGIRSTLMTVFGTVVSSGSNGLVVSYQPDLSRPITYFQMSGSLSYYVCSIDGGEVEYTVGSVNDIVDGGDVFVQSRDGMHQDVYIIRYR